MQKTLSLAPLDTLFFRDDRPFHQDDEGLAEASSMFPPMPQVVAGALRASMARAQGWDGTKPDWARFKDELGDGPLNPGKLDFGAPILLVRGRLDELDVWLPCPSALLVRPPTPEERKQQDKPRERRFEEVCLARPGPPEEECDTDAGPARRLPVLGRDDAHTFKQRADLWIRAEGMQSLLRGATSLSRPWYDLRSLAQLVQPQRRIGLEREPGTHRAVTGRLYQAIHQRPRHGVAIGVSYRAADGSARALPEPQPVLLMGGHGRAVAVEPGHNAAMPEGPADADYEVDGGWLNYMVVLLSPTLLDQSERQTLPGLPGEVVSAVLDKPLAFGGWDIQHNKRLPNARYLRAGSTFFCRAEGARAAILNSLRKAQEEGLGRADTRRVGCGAFLVGTWKELG